MEKVKSWKRENASAIAEIMVAPNNYERTRSAFLEIASFIEIWSAIHKTKSEGTRCALHLLMGGVCEHIRTVEEEC
jgi:hypothetical protein